MRRATWAAAALAALLALPAEATSQSHQNGGVGTATDAVPDTTAPAVCDYDTCGLRLRDSDVLEGRSGDRVARFGFFRPPDMAERFAPSDSAAMYLEVVEESYTQGRVLWFAGQVVSAVGGALFFSSDRRAQGWGFALQAVGFSAGWLGRRGVGAAEEAMSRAIWWYNRDVARVPARPGRR